MSRDPFASLREALRQSPDNIPLRQHLAESLLERGFADQAEQEYRQALSLAPRDPSLKVGLARAFFQQGKDSEAFVVLEELQKHRDTPAEAYLLLARLHLRNEQV